jgi:hypothetical protein
VDSVRYEYSAETRESRITFRKTQQGLPASGGKMAGSANARD